jgi:putative FmdB family regulatory protein
MKARARGNRRGLRRPGREAEVGIASSVAAWQVVCYMSRTFSPNPNLSMPTYEYQCEKCKKTFELSQSMKDDALKTCPKEQCRMKTWGKGKVKRLLGTGAGLIFKGSGFYITDYRSEGYKSAERKDSAPSETKEKKSETPSKTESKPAAPAPAPEKSKGKPKND